MTYKSKRKNTKKKSFRRKNKIIKTRKKYTKKSYKKFKGGNAINDIQNGINQNDYYQVKQGIDSIKSSNNFQPKHILEVVNKVIPLAAYKCNEDIFNLLIENNADVNLHIENSDVYDRLQLHTGKGFLKIYPSTARNFLKSPLHYAIYGSNAKIVKIILEKGADVHGHVSVGNNDIYEELQSFEITSPLHIAANIESNEIRKDIVKMLLNKNHHVNIPYTIQISHFVLNFIPLTIFSDYEIIKMLVEKGANVNQKIAHNLFGDWCIVSPLHIQAQKGNAQIAQLFIEKGASINEPVILDPNSRNSSHHQNDFTINSTPLHLACQNNLEVANYLIDAGADIHAVNIGGSTPLHVACKFNSKDLIEKLIKKGADINKNNKKGNTPLMITVKNGYVESTELLLKHNADINKLETSTGNTTLHLAAKGNRINVALLLITKGADIYKKNNDGKTPIDIITSNCSFPIPKINDLKQKYCMVKGSFLQRKSIDSSFKKGSPIFKLRDDIDGLSTRFEYWIINNINDPTKRFQIDDAIINSLGEFIQKFKDLQKYKEAIESLIFIMKESKMGNEICNQNNNQDIIEKQTGGTIQSDFEEACRNGDIKVVMDLIDKGADVNASNNWGNTPLHYALDNGHTEVAMALIDKGADLNARNNDGYTPLHIALMKGHTEAAMAVIDKGADVNARNNDGYTPLHYALSYGHSEVAMAVIDKGADVNARDNNGDTPLHHALSYGHSEVAMAVIDKGADVNARDRYERTPLHDACRNGRTEAAMAAIDKGADVNARDMYGDTPLHDALNSGRNSNHPKILNYELAMAITEKGADIYQKNKKGETAIDIINNLQSWDNSSNYKIKGIKNLKENYSLVKEKYYLDNDPQFQQKYNIAIIFEDPNSNLNKLYSEIKESVINLDNLITCMNLGDTKYEHEKCSEHSNKFIQNFRKFDDFIILVEQVYQQILEIYNKPEEEKKKSFLGKISSLLKK